MDNLNHRSVRPQLFTACLGTSVAAMALSCFLLLRDRLPSDVIATHWNENGQADGAGTVLSFLLIANALALVPALGSGVVVLAPIPGRIRARVFWMAVGGTVYFGALAGCMSWSVAVLNQGASTWQEAASMRESHLAVLALFPLVLGVGAVLAAQRIWPHEALAAPLASSLNLEADERVFWSSSVRSSTWLLIGGPITLGLSYVVAEYLGATLSALVLIISVVLADTFSMLRVSVNFRGLSLRYGHFGLFRQHIPLATIDGARRIDVRPLAHGGWGYRGSLYLLRKAAVVVRAGDGIELTLKGGRVFVVTVNDAATGAALLNGLVQQKESRTA